MTTEKVPLSVAVITKNEEKNLPRLLESVAFAAEIVVVDSGSADRTVEIAKQAGCRVFVEDWKGDGPQKNSAIDKCSHEWVLVLDADERIPEDTGLEIKRIVADPSSADAYRFPRKNFFHGRWIRTCGWWPDRIIRLFRKHTGRYTAITHGRWETTGSLADTALPIEHFSFTGYTHMLRVLEVRSRDMAQELYDEGRRATVLSPFLHGIAMFFKVYIQKRGFIEGFDGFVIALTRAGGTFFKYAILLEIQRAKEGS
ncbi:MAG: glycosyltransferase family 2 protein [Nitrospiraceae bacterium]|nr:glycosyltransferase family 2 protein [Nitrospiraceae bacterium]